MMFDIRSRQGHHILAVASPSHHIAIYPFKVKILGLKGSSQTRPDADIPTSSRSPDMAAAGETSFWRHVACVSAHVGCADTPRKPSHENEEGPKSASLTTRRTKMTEEGPRPGTSRPALDIERHQVRHSIKVWPRSRDRKCPPSSPRRLARRGLSSVSLEAG